MNGPKTQREKRNEKKKKKKWFSMHPTNLNVYVVLPNPPLPCEDGGRGVTDPDGEEVVAVALSVNCPIPDGIRSNRTRSIFRLRGSTVIAFPRPNNTTVTMIMTSRMIAIMMIPFLVV